jgi:hypothetical protein
MNTSLHSMLLRCALCFGIVVCGCIPAMRQGKSNAAFPVVNEKIFLYPVADSSSLELFKGWPSEKPLQEILLRHFRKLDAALLFEFRKREKYGLYEIVEDSLRSSVRVAFVVGKFRADKDELAFPVRMTVRRLSDNAARAFSFESSGMYRAKSRPKSDVHYLDLLLADFRRHFPFQKAAGIFYRPCEPGGACP